MSNKMKIFNDDLSNLPIITAPAIKYEAVKAAGTNILVELLTAEEVMGSTLHLPTNTKMPAIQGIILDIGPALKGEEWGIEVGDRVVLWGDFVPVPKPKSVQESNKKDWGVYPPHAIKAVLK